jgi:HupE / UreJ protein
MPNGTVTTRTLTILGAALFLALPYAAAAHDIPNDATVQVFVKPAGERLSLLVRAPLKTMRDVDFPETPKGYLDLPEVDPMLRKAAALWIGDAFELYEGNTRLPKPKIVTARVSLPSDKSFISYEKALAHLTGPMLPANADVYWDQVLLDVWFEYPIHSDRSNFSVHPGIENLALQVVTALQFLPPSGVDRAFEFVGDPGLVRLDPRWYQAALRFVDLGFFHILGGTDHLLFLFCLVIPFRRLRALIPVVTSFTVAHSMTLIASAYNLAPGALWFPPLIETLIAISIVYMALENIVGAKVERRWIITFGFGLVHGFGFSFALRETLQFAGSHLLTSLLSFNVGVELGQLLVLVLLIPALELLFRFVVAERMGTIILSALVAHTAWHWMVDRADRLMLYQFEWPALTASLLASVALWLMLIVIFAALLWLVFGVLGWRPGRRVQDESAPVGPASAEISESAVSE